MSSPPRTVGQTDNDCNSTAAVTLPQEEVLRLTMLQDTDSEYYLNDTNETAAAGAITTAMDTIPDVDHETVSSLVTKFERGTSQDASTLESTTSRDYNDDDVGGSVSAIASVSHNSTCTTPEMRSPKSVRSPSSSRKSTTSKSPRSGRKKPKPTGNSNSYEKEREAPRRTRSGGNSHSNSHEKERETPKRTRSGGNSGNSKLKRAVKNERKSVDAVIAAAIRNYEELESSTRSHSTTRSGRSHSTNRSRSHSTNRSRSTTPRRQQRRSRSRSTPRSRPSSRPNSRPTTPRRSRSRSATRKRRNTPLRTKSGDVEKSRTLPKRTKSGSSGHGDPEKRRNTPLRTKSGSNGRKDEHGDAEKHRNTPKRTKSGSSGRKDDHTSPDKTRNSPKRTKSGSGGKKKGGTRSGHIGHLSRSISSDDATTSAVDGSSSAKKKKRRGSKKRSLEHGLLQQSSSLDSSINEGGDDPPPLEEGISSSSYQDHRAGAIAIFPSDSGQTNERRPNSDRTRIGGDHAHDTMNLFTNDEEARIRRGPTAPQRSNSMDTYEEVPEPPQSQVIHATATLPGAPRQPPIHSNSSAAAANPSSAMSTLSGPYGGSTAPTMSTEESNTTDGILSTTVLRDVESGTVTAQAISSENYYEEVRRQLRAEAVMAVDVIPLDERDRPTNEELEHQKKKEQNDRAAKRRQKYFCMGCGIGLLVLILIGVLVPISRRRQRRKPKPNPDATRPDEMDQEAIAEMMEGAAGEYWRRKVARILPESTLINIISDPDMTSPQYNAFIYLVRNSETLFGADIMDTDMDADMSAVDTTRVSILFGLVTVYYALDGDNWYTNQNWLDPNAELCSWEGINCPDDLYNDAIMQSTQPNTGNNNDLFPPPPGDTDKPPQDKNAGSGNQESQPPRRPNAKVAIESVNLMANKLAGIIPDEISLLQVYGEINLSFNKISGTIPTYFGELSKLQSLNLRNTLIASPLPTEMGQMSRLRKLDFTNVNGITGTIPVEFANLRQIENLQIQNTSLEGAVPRAFCDMLDTREDVVDGRAPFRYKFEDSLVFRATCPYKIDCPCCSECCEVGREEDCSPNL